MRLPPTIPALVTLLALAAAPLASAQYQRPSYESQQSKNLLLSKQAREAGTLEQRVGHLVPRDLTFTDSTGQAVTLGEIFDEGKPVVLQPAYFACPELCQAISVGVANAVGRLGLGDEEYRVVTVSFDPAEGTELAAENKAASLELARKPGMAGSWRYLTGDQPNIDGLLEAVGYNVGYIEEADLWAHPDALVILSPEGRVIRYLRGTAYAPRTLGLSLVEASDNEIGTILDQVFLTCFQYDAAMGEYTPFARNLMRGAAILTVMTIAGGVGFALLRERSRRGPGGEGGGQDGGPRPAVT